MNFMDDSPYLGFLNPTAYPWLVEVFVLVLLTLLARYALTFFLHKLESQFKKTANLWDDAMLEAARKPLGFLVWLMGFSLVLEILIHKSPAVIFATVAPARELLVIVLLSWFLIRVIRQAEMRLITNIVPYQSFATADGHIILAVGNDGQFTRFCELAGDSDLANDPRFATNRQRVQNRETLVTKIANLMCQQSSQWWLDKLSAQGVPCGPINTLDQVFDDPQVQHRGMQIALDHPLTGTVPSIANPIKFSATPIEYGNAAPRVGEHSKQVLEELLQLPEENWQELITQGIVE